MPVLLRKISRSSISMSKIESEFTTTKHLSRLIEQGKRPTVIVVDMQQTLLGRKIPGNPRM
ncbi:hypothetical protein [Pelagibaculum spongiae]|uniref:hypothetical protein n=1 Tax=Pelagibaculum spongiae TaxID=2080658 RepID=UPI001057A4E7|nr:hypothetical protein [Pelagibaculum spongiae]